MCDVLSSKDAERVAQMHRNCFKVMMKRCKACGSQLRPEDPYEWAFVSLVSQDNRLDPKEVYVVRVDNLRNARSKSFAKTIGNDGGKTRVSLTIYFSCFVLLKLAVNC